MTYVVEILIVYDEIKIKSDYSEMTCLPERYKAHDNNDEL